MPMVLHLIKEIISKFSGVTAQLGSKMSNADSQPPRKQVLLNFKALTNDDKESAPQKRHQQHEALLAKAKTCTLFVLVKLIENSAVQTKPAGATK